MSLVSGRYDTLAPRRRFVRFNSRIVLTMRDFTLTHLVARYQGHVVPRSTVETGLGEFE